MSTLEIVELGTGEVRLCVVVGAGEEFTLSYIHSVNKRPVYDTLRAQGDHLIIVKSHFDAFGAGMPDGSTEEGTFAVLADGWLEWTVNRAVPEIIVRVGRVAEHALWLQGRQLPLSGLAQPGSALALRVHRSSIFRTLIRWKL